MKAIRCKERMKGRIKSEEEIKKQKETKRKKREEREKYKPPKIKWDVSSIEYKEFLRECGRKGAQKSIDIRKYRMVG
jgi:hypothetical protein